jgi:hypothetical protein
MAGMGSSSSLLSAFAMLLLVVVGGCESKLAQERLLTLEAIEGRVNDAERRFRETGNPVYNVHAEQQEKGMALLVPELPKVPTPYFAYLAGPGSFPKGQLLVFWIERGMFVNAIEIRIGTETVTYPVEYTERTLGTRLEEGLERVYHVYFADEPSVHPTLRSDEVIIFSHNESDKLLRGTLAASVRLVYGDQKTSDWITCVPPIRSLEEKN